mmetsp:Transcript_16810/g.29102  ORF Transcript_16810/g.29102 Transcript_16810/m.29102 type:complete len:160 (+) Transcript_16810:23-502(+)|eukprot:CAMPEP_0196659192 /NCGR_PEP_ID=MMETSP1086-20130531/33616_1 /TAXON_ID=77921 /ORGANISM="Cyanoptyche  gloeocystis , Strain SAG4.97" /LENGTH=159 /DNA_ID=CAMNT_0041993069 /DNA_START=23 /DNA_END=502 /DNA_ORIENTATION=+
MGVKKKVDDAEDDEMLDEDDAKDGNYVPTSETPGRSERRSSRRTRKVSQALRVVDEETKREVRNARLEALDSDLPVEDKKKDDDDDFMLDDSDDENAAFVKKKKRPKKEIKTSAKKEKHIKRFQQLLLESVLTTSCRFKERIASVLLTGSALFFWYRRI